MYPPPPPKAPACFSTDLVAKGRRELLDEERGLSFGKGGKDLISKGLLTLQAPGGGMV